MSIGGVDVLRGTCCSSSLAWIYVFSIPVRPVAQKFCWERGTAPVIPVERHLVFRELWIMRMNTRWNRDRVYTPLKSLRIPLGIVSAVLKIVLKAKHTNYIQGGAATYLNQKLWNNAWCPSWKLTATKGPFFPGTVTDVSTLAIDVVAGRLEK